MIQPLPLLIRLALSALVLAAGVFDIRQRRIPNWLNLAGVVAGIGLNTWHSGLAGPLRAVEGMALGFVVYLLLFLIRAMGGGDVKLTAAVGVMVGPGNWLLIFLASSILGGVFAVILIVLTGRVRRTVLNIGYLLRELVCLRAPHLSREELDVGNPAAVTLPHAAVIALATLAYFVAIPTPVH